MPSNSSILGRPEASPPFVEFIAKQISAALFAILLLIAIVATYYLYPRDLALARYDFLFLLAIGIQAALLASGLERWEEAKVIALFHLLGTVMELYKTAHGSWTYPEANLIRIAGVPLFSGFMYATVGSYIARAWRLYGLRFSRYPHVAWTALAAAAIYVNFFAHHYMADMRYLILAGLILIYGRTVVQLRLGARQVRLPLLLVFFAVALSLWIAENIATYSAIWLYPHQLKNGWTPVSLSKFGSWFLLMNVSFVLVALVHRPEPPETPP